MTAEEKEIKFEKLLQENNYINLREFITANDCYDLINKNLFSVIERVRFSPILITEIKRIKNYGMIFSDNIINILKKNYSINRIYNIYSTFNEKEYNIIRRNIKKIYEELTLEMFIIFKDYMIENEKATNDLFSFMYEDKDKFTSKIIDANKDLIAPEDRDSIIELTKKLLEEICVHENVKFNKIKYLGTGVYSCVFQIGDKVIKFGSRKKFTAPNTKYLLKPLIRINFNEICNSKLVLEVTEVVNIKDRITFKDMTLIDKDMKKTGVHFKDIKEDNFGKLIKDNKKHWNKDLGDHNGIIGTCDEQLKAGDYVINDTDYLYNEKEKNTPGSMGYELYKYMCNEKENYFKYFLSTRIYNINSLSEELEKGDFLDIVNSNFEQIFSTLHRSIIDIIDISKIKGYESIIDDNINIISKFYDEELIDYVKTTLEELRPKIR